MAAPLSSGSSRPKFSEIKMYENTKERDNFERLADLYSIIKATELLEAAYARDAITPNEYSDACNRLIGQFKTTEKGLVLSKAIESADSFFKEYQIDCPRAYERLVISGLGCLFLVILVFNSCFR
jgi:ESCRT-I complex subunit VPS28